MSLDNETVEKLGNSILSIASVLRKIQGRQSEALDMLENIGTSIINDPTTLPRLAPYGYCQDCGKLGSNRERSPNGDTTCSAGHKYPSTAALETPKP